MNGERCSWCGAEVGRDEGYRLAEEAGERVAVACRLEHVVPWVMQGPHWNPGVLAERPREEEELRQCAICGADVDDTRVLAVHHRGEHRIADAFCGAEHLRAWAAAGGRWR